MSPLPPLFVGICAGFLAGACTAERSEVRTGPPGQDSGVADAPSALETGLADPACLPGATGEDCRRCGAGRGCKRACPKVDCSVFPLPEACLAACDTGDCCACEQTTSIEYSWGRPLQPFKCGNFCSGARDAWRALMDDPRMKAC